MQTQNLIYELRKRLANGEYRDHKKEFDALEWDINVEGTNAEIEKEKNANS